MNFPTSPSNTPGSHLSTSASSNTMPGSRAAHFLPPPQRPELRLAMPATTYAPGVADLPPYSAATASPVPDTPYSAASPSSTVSSNSPLLTEVPLIAPRLRASQSLQTMQRGMHPPPALPQLLPSASTSSADHARAERVEPSDRRGTRLAKASSLPSCAPPAAASPSAARLAHPYARIYAKKAAAPAAKRRKMWNHALEKSLFTPEEIANMGAPNRRAIYTASLEHHVDQLHAQMLAVGLYPVPLETLEQYRGLNSKTAKSMVAGLHKDACDLKTQLMELDRATKMLQRTHEDGASNAADAAAQQRRHSVSTASYVYPNLFVDTQAGSSMSKPRTTMS